MNLNNLFRTVDITMSDDRSGPENAKIMRGWELNEYGGIDALTFSQNILLPQIKSPTDVLVEVIATSVNPLDQLQTGGCVRVCRDHSTKLHVKPNRLIVSIHFCYSFSGLWTNRIEYIALV